jgi:hypothetical protein
MTLEWLSLQVTYKLLLGAGGILEVVINSELIFLFKTYLSDMPDNLLFVDLFKLAIINIFFDVEESIISLQEFSE